MDTNQPSAYRVVIIDGMAVVNSVIKTDQMKTCQDFAESFLAIICNMAANYDEVRLVFDRYMKTSLKEDEDKEDQRKVNILPCEGHHFCHVSATLSD